MYGLPSVVSSAASPPMIADFASLDQLVGDLDVAEKIGPRGRRDRRDRLLHLRAGDAGNWSECRNCQYDLVFEDATFGVDFLDRLVAPSRNCHRDTAPVPDISPT